MGVGVLFAKCGSVLSAHQGEGVQLLRVRSMWEKGTFQPFRKLSTRAAPRSFITSSLQTLPVVREVGR